MLLCNDDDLALKMRQIGNHGQDVRYSHKYVGINGRLDTIQAAILRVKLKYLAKEIEQRIVLAERYCEHLKDVVVVPYREPHNKHVYNQFTIRTSNRDDLCKYLNENGIPTAIHYPVSLHKQECFKSLGYKDGDFPVAERCAKEVMSLPMFPSMTTEQQDEVIGTIRNFFK
jgi:dTDP-4-amino-4,6-dideoxygalactose transaminase